MRDIDSIYAGTFHPSINDGGVIKLNRIPVDAEGIHVNLKQRVLQILTDEFTVDSARKALSAEGFEVINQTVHGVGYGKSFFFDFKALPVGVKVGR